MSWYGSRMKNYTDVNTNNVAVFLRIVYFVNIVMSALSSVRAGATVHAG